MTKITITKEVMTKIEALTKMMKMKMKMTKTRTRTEDELIARLRERGCWYDFNDKSTWFRNEALTAWALQPEDVRYVKNKAGPGYMKIERVEVDSQGRHFVESSSSVNMYTYFLTDKPLPLDDLEALEQRFMRDMEKK